MTSESNTPAQRLENIRAVQPYIEALKTISLSKWRTSLTKTSRLSAYISELETGFHIVQPYVESISKPLLKKIILIIGTDQGFCGNLNKRIFEYFTSMSHDSDSQHLQTYVMGSKLIKIFKENHVNIKPFPQLGRNDAINLKTLSKFIVETVLAQEATLQVLSFDYHKAGQGQLGLKTIIPLEIPKSEITQEITDTYIIDTDTSDLYGYLAHRLETTRLYDKYLSAIAYENSLRYQIMENATKNADQLIEELQIEVLAIRRQKITSEIRELAISAGLLDKKK